MAKIAIVVSRFNGDITQRLLEGARAALAEHGGLAGPPTEVWVPGAFEIPLAALRLARSGRYGAVICLGAVIRGETPHFDYVCRAAADGVLRAGLDTGVPVIFGVLTADTMAQARARAQVPAKGKNWAALSGHRQKGKKAVANKGWDAALAGIEMAALMKNLEGSR